MSDKVWTYEGRVATFKPKPARRASSAKGIKAAKATKWPHEFLSPERLADAGFYYNPSAEENDNVTCFLCDKSIVGWEEDDDPLAEHLKLSSECGWAIIASLQAKNDELLKENPLGERLTEARKATFADKWPHEHKANWICRTSRLVEAGWTFQPTPEYDDLTSCPYCELSLDGWEQEDNPMEQHQKRNPDCTFFTLSEQYALAAPKKKTVRTKKARASKASRVSDQSALEGATELPSFVDQSVAEDDSILTVTTTSTKSGTKRPRKATASKKAPRTTRASRTSQISQSVDAGPAEEEEDDTRMENMSAQINDSTLTSVADTLDTTASHKALPKKKAASKSAAGRKAKILKPAAEIANVDDDIDESAAVMREPEDDDFEVKIPIKPKASRSRKRTSDEMEQSVLTITAEPMTKRRTTRNTRASTADTQKVTRGKKKELDDPDFTTEAVAQTSNSTQPQHGQMFDPSPLDIDDEELDAELELMAQLQVPVVNQAVEVADIIVAEDEFETALEPEDDVEEFLHDNKVDANAVESPLSGSEDVENDIAQQNTANIVSEMDDVASYTARPSITTEKSESAQSSDAENRPPPTNQSPIKSPNTPRRIPLAVSTPQASPSKRTVISNLQSKLNWEAIDLDAILLQSPSTTTAFGAAIEKAKQGNLTDNEARMTVEAWIRHNAVMAETSLKAECERMVSTFEREGLKALKVLASIQCVD